MIEIVSLHKPRWQPDGDDWLMIVGNHLMAALVPNSDQRLPQYHWLSLILAEDCFDGLGWHGVDFETLEDGKLVLEQWWDHDCRGERYRS
jgi:hypothetical protein